MGQTHPPSCPGCRGTGQKISQVVKVSRWTTTYQYAKTLCPRTVQRLKS